MRTFKPTYSVPIPDGAKRLKRRDGVYYRFDKGGQEITAKATRGGRRVSMASKCYYVEFMDLQDRQRRLKAFSDRGASNRLATTVEDILNARGSGQGVGDDLRRRIEALPKSVRAKLADWDVLDPRSMMAAKPLIELLSMYKTHLKAKGRCSQYYEKTVSAATAVFKACGYRVFDDIRADKIAAYLEQRREQGISYRRSNAILMSCKCFCSWMVKSAYVNESPLSGGKVGLLNVEQDRRRIRRALELDELHRLFKAAEESTEVLFHLTGPQRTLIYRFAAETGIRKGAMGKLVVGDFDLPDMVVNVPAKITKGKRARSIPLTTDMVAMLRQHFANKLPTTPAFAIPYDPPIMLRHDLEAAGIPYRDEQGRVFDFHSLRGVCASLLIEGGVSPKIAMEWLGHSDISLTLSVYAKTLDEKAKKRAAAAAISNLIEKAG
ncbi:MAG: tyrosine-type recombinase/integrase [Planctomycetota bacterium]|jgi:integrase